MKFTRRNAAKLMAIPVLFHLSRTTHARTIQKVDKSFKEAVQAAMLEYIDATRMDGKNLIFDPIKGDFIHARLQKLHNNLSLVANRFYVSCADFKDEQGQLLDVDFMVAEQDGFWAVFQSVIHKRDNQLRNAHMEEAQVIFAKTSGCCAAGCAAKCCAAASQNK